MEEGKRVNWDEYFVTLTKMIATRSTCPKRNVGAILVKDKRILATGHSGSVKGLEHCDKIGCLVKYIYDSEGNKHDKCVRTIHAELNAIIQCAMHGVSSKGATLYASFEPCDTCAKALINAGIKRVVVAEIYEDKSRAELSRKWFEEAGIPVEEIKPKTEQN